MQFNLKNYLAKWRALVDSYLKKILGEKFDTPVELVKSIKYSVLGNGKRLRPILVLAATEACGGKLQGALPTAAAVEMIHAYSLIHDDLPAMDNASLRRGRPTNHKVFGEATAILAGDALMPLAINIIAQKTKGVPAPKILQVIDLITKASGIEGMVGGQAADLAAEGKSKKGDKRKNTKTKSRKIKNNNKVTPAQLKYIHSKKTGALLEACVKAGALLAGAGPAKVARMTSCGRHLGLAFQIIDDILDVTGSTKKLGKTAGQDTAAGKATYPALYGLAEAQRKAAAEIKAALAELGSFGPAAEPLRALAGYFAARQN